jgi:hypothetical protein
MFANLTRLFAEGVVFTASKAKAVHNTLIGVIVAAFAVIVLMWYINISGGKAYNIVLFLAGGLYIAVSFSRPLVAATAAGAGAVVAGLADKDLSQGALTGLKALYKVTVGTLFGFWVLAGLLATWSFEKNPSSFFYVMAMVLTIAVTVELFEMKSNKLAAKVIITYAIGVIAVAFWQTIDNQPNLNEFTPSGWKMPASSVSRGEVVKVDYPTFRGGIGRSVATGSWDSAFEVQFPTGRANTGMVWGVCPQVIKPAKTPVQMAWEWSNNGRSTGQVRFTDQSRIKLAEELVKLGVSSTTTIEVSFTYIEVPQGTTDVCARLLEKLIG